MLKFSEAIVSNIMEEFHQIVSLSSGFYEHIRDLIHSEQQKRQEWEAPARQNWGLTEQT